MTHPTKPSASIEQLPEPIIFRDVPTVTGSARGRTLGVPTINLDLRAIPANMKHGVYACFVEIGDRSYDGAMSFGPRPSVSEGIAMEIHLIDEQRKSLPPTVTVRIVARIRDIRKFKTTAALVAQIQQDIGMIRDILHPESM